MYGVFKKEFSVSNPSPYERSDYVEVDLKALEVPPELDEYSLILYRLNEKGGKKTPIPFQIDHILGEKNKRRFMTFLSERTPPGNNDYSAVSALYCLEKKKSDIFGKDKNLRLGYYYAKPKKNEPADGYSPEFQKERVVKGVEFSNGEIDFHLNLLPRSVINESFSGAMTYICLKKASADNGRGEMLAHDWRHPYKKWGQLTQLAFFPLPWKTEWFHKVSMLDKKYELIYSHCGPVRAVATFKSETIEIVFRGDPYFKPNYVKVQANLYRIIYVYPNSPFYTEVIFVQTPDGVSLSFRPYYASFLYYPDVISSRLYKNVDYVECEGYREVYQGNPSYFALWKYFTDGARCMAFASNIRIRSLEFASGNLEWRIANSHHNKSVHYFMYESDPGRWRDPLHTIGHDGWYQMIYKPLEVTPLSMKYPTHQSVREMEEVNQHD